MNKLILLLGLSIVLTAQAQVSITVTGSSTDISGATHMVSTTPDQEAVVDLLFHNNTGLDQSWKITRLHVTMPNGWTNYVCWGLEGGLGNCYGANANTSWVTPDAFTIPTGQAGLGTMHINPNSNSGIAKIRYYITKGSSFMDSVDVEVSSTLGIKEVKQEVTLSIMPNPVSEMLTINYSGTDAAQVKVMDILGNVVYKDQMIQQKKIDVSDFKSGVYFVIIDGAGIKPISRKLVVRH